MTSNKKNFNHLKNFILKITMANGTSYWPYWIASTIKTHDVKWPASLIVATWKEVLNKNPPMLRQDIDEYQESHIVKNFFPAVEGLVSYTRLMGENKLAKGNTSKKKIDFFSGIAKNYLSPQFGQLAPLFLDVKNDV